MQIIECVPNVSEGRDKSIIDTLAKSIISNNDTVKLLNVDIGYDANRTVFTYIGQKDDVYKATFRLCETALTLIDMRHHTGIHPRTGAVDVIPFVPIKNITLEECADMARDFAKEIYDRLGISSNCYESAAYFTFKKNLANCRIGEYEGIEDRLDKPDMKPDFGDKIYTENLAKYGISNVGARNFLIAINFNLNTKDVSIAKYIAEHIRQSGYYLKNSDGSLCVDNQGNRLRIKGELTGCKAIGWYCEQYGQVQVSCNIVDTNCLISEVYNRINYYANQFGLHITATECIGLIPIDCIINAARQFCQDKDIPKEKSIDIVKRSMDIIELRILDVDKLFKS